MRRSPSSVTRPMEPEGMNAMEYLWGRSSEASSCRKMLTSIPRLRARTRQADSIAGEESDTIDRNARQRHGNEKADPIRTWARGRGRLPCGRDRGNRRVHLLARLACPGHRALVQRLPYAAIVGSALQRDDHVSRMRSGWQLRPKSCLTLGPSALLPDPGSGEHVRLRPRIRVQRSVHGRPRFAK